MTDGLIGNLHVAVPDLMERVIAFRSLNYSGPVEFKEPNEFKVDVATGKIVRNDEVIQQKLEEAKERYGEPKYADEKTLLGTLHSPQYNKDCKPWKKEMVAECGAGQKHKAPESSCACGLYCYYELKAINCNYNYSGREVYVCVSVEGKIEAHTTGMRAEKMRIEALYALSYTGLSQLCEALEVSFFPIESYSKEQFLAHCQEYGDQLPDNMRAK